MIAISHAAIILSNKNLIRKQEPYKIFGVTLKVFDYLIYNLLILIPKSLIFRDWAENK